MYYVLFAAVIVAICFIAFLFWPERCLNCKSRDLEIRIRHVPQRASTGKETAQRVREVTCWDCESRFLQTENE